MATGEVDRERKWAGRDVAGRKGRRTMAARPWRQQRGSGTGPHAAQRGTRSTGGVIHRQRAVGCNLIFFMHHLTHHVLKSGLQRGAANTRQGTKAATSAVRARQRQAAGAQATMYFIRIRSAVAVVVIEGREQRGRGQK